MSFKSIMSEVNGDNGLSIKAPTQKEEPEIDREQWEAAGREFILQCEADLFSSIGEKPLAYLQARGLSIETIAAWRIGYSSMEGWGDASEWGLPPGEKIFIPAGIVIPNFEGDKLHGIKVRKREGDPRYLLLKGSSIFIYGSRTMQDSAILFLFEGEFDCLLAWQTGYHLSYAALPAGQPIRRDYAELFKPIADVIVCSDNDDAGRLSQEKLCALPHFYPCKPLPHGKDLTEYMLQGGDVLDWLLEQVDHLQELHNGT